MLLGSELGRLSLGQLPGKNGFAQGATITVTASIIEGVAQGFGPPSQSARAGGPVGYHKRKQEEKLDAQAWGAVFTIGTRVETGIATGEIVVPMPEPLAPRLVPDFEPIPVTIIGDVPDPVPVLRETAEFKPEPVSIVQNPPEPVAVLKKDWTLYDANLLELI